MTFRLLKFPFMLWLAVAFLIADLCEKAWQMTLKFEDWQPKERP